jgi:hypothetical protein
MGRTRLFGILNLVVHKVTTKLYMISNRSVTVQCMTSAWRRVAIGADSHWTYQESLHILWEVDHPYDCFECASVGPILRQSNSSTPSNNFFSWSSLILFSHIRVRPSRCLMKFADWILVGMSHLLSFAGAIQLNVPLLTNTVCFICPNVILLFMDGTILTG